MIRKELDALKAELLKQKEKSADMEILTKSLFGLLHHISALLPNEVKEVLKSMVIKATFSV